METVEILNEIKEMPLNEDRINRVKNFINEDEKFKVPFHGDENTRSPEECYEMLLYLNWLFRHLP